MSNVENVSIVIPVYNEEKYIEKLINSIINQDYQHDKIECIFVDGNSSDKTIKIIDSILKNSDIDYRIIVNPKRVTPSSVNLGIRNAKYDIIIRLDAHSEYPESYVSKNVFYLNTTNADNVGCTCITKCDGKNGKVIESILTSRFGVGNSEFRTNGSNGYVDTVPFGTFRKSLVDEIGYFNEELPRSEDNEFNYRIRKSGRKVYMFNDISSIYHPRNTIKSLCKMAFQNGNWILYTNKIMPGSMGVRHFIPFLFVIGLIIGLIMLFLNISILNYIYFGVICTYLLIDFIFTIKDVVSKGICNILCFFIYPMFHISYGIGTLFGISKIFNKKGDEKNV